MKIGFLTDNYPEKRCIINKIETMTYKNIGYHSDPVFFIKKILTRIKVRKRTLDDSASIRPVFSHGMDIIHTFNTICITNKKWVVSFESIVPRDAEITSVSWLDVLNYTPSHLTRRLLTELGKENCLGILGISNASLSLQKNFLEKISFSEEIKRNIIKKMQAIHPPQECLVDQKFLEKKYEASIDVVKFIFVGRQFFRKGGKEITEVFQELEADYNFEVCIISSMDIEDGINFYNAEDKEKYRELLTEKDWIKFHENLENADVLNMCKEYHVGLLPTFSETYGYSVLEMQACGVPVITTNVRALPEINSEKCGWICQLPLNENKEIELNTTEKITEFQATLKNELRRKIITILENPEEIKNKAFSALRRIKLEHSKEKYAEKINNVYQQTNK